MLAKKDTLNQDVFGPEDLRRMLRKYIPDDVADLIDEVTVEVEDDQPDGKEQLSNKYFPASRFGLVSTGGETIYWVWLIGRARHGPKSKRFLAFSGFIVGVLGLIYQYIQTNGDQIVAFLRGLLQGA